MNNETTTTPSLPATAETGLSADPMTLFRKKRSPGALAVRKSEAKRRAAGAVRIPNGWLTPDAYHALCRLMLQKYESTRTGVICRALLDALKTLN